jgi:hypothetical protein
MSYPENHNGKYSGGDVAARPDFDFVLVRSDAGDGGWSLYAPGSTPAQIASGKAPPLVSGIAKWNDELARISHTTNCPPAT